MLLPLPWSLSATAPPPLAAIVIVKLIVGPTVLPMLHRQHHIRHCRRCGPILEPIPPPPPANRRRWVAFLLGTPPPSGDVGERALEGAPATVIASHAAMDNGDGHSLLWHSLCMMQQYNTQGTIWGRATIGPKQKRDCGTNQHKPLQTGTDRHKPAQIGTNQHFFLCRGGGGSLAPFSGPLNIIVD